MDIEEDTDHYGHFQTFPYHDKVGKYVIHKKRQRDVLWLTFFDRKSYCRDTEKDELIWKVCVNISAHNTGISPHTQHEHYSGLR